MCRPDAPMSAPSTLGRKKVDVDQTAQIGNPWTNDPIRRRLGHVGVAHGVELSSEELFFSEVQFFGGPAPVRRFLPDLIERIWSRTIDPGEVLDLELPLDEAAEGYRAMNERRAIKTLLWL
jgi:threonine dehydrogenase-like Zn-dependent dehydrogenase